MKKLLPFLFLALASTATAQTPKLAIRFPAFKPVPVANDAPAKLTLDSFYVIDSDTPILVLASPDGMVKIAEEVGPIKVRGRFADGGVNVETREYKGKQVFFIEATGKGTVELLIIPVGATKADAVLRKVIAVDDGTAPRPPPDPKPDVKPIADAAFPQDGKIRVLILYESSEPNKLTPDQHSAIFGQKVRTWLDTHCAIGPDGKTREYAIYDKDVSITTKGELWKKAFEKAKAFNVPAIVVSNGREEFIGAMPATGVLDLLKKYGGE